MNPAQYHNRRCEELMVLAALAAGLAIWLCPDPVWYGIGGIFAVLGFILWCAADWHFEMASGCRGSCGIDHKP